MPKCAGIGYFIEVTGEKTLPDSVDFCRLHALLRNPHLHTLPLGSHAHNYSPIPYHESKPGCIFKFGGRVFFPDVEGL
jgi:hypothetical protein